MIGHDDVAITPAGEFLRRAHAGLPGRSLPTPSRREPARRRLFTSTVPVPGESLRGLVARACAANYIPNSWGVLQHVGLTHRNRVLLSEDPNVVTADLAHAVGTTEDEIIFRRYEPLPAGHLSFFGLDVHRRQLENRIRRFSPLSLAEHPCHRAIWEVRDLPFCPYGWDILQERCPCEGDDGVLQGWTRTLSPVDCCDRCGDPLSWLEPIRVPDAMRGDLSLMLSLVGTSPDERCLGRPIPLPLLEADRSRIFDVVRRLAAALSGEFDHDRQDLEAALARCDALQRACRSLIDWPTGIGRLSPSEGYSPEGWLQLVLDYDRLAGRVVHGSSYEFVGIRQAISIGQFGDDMLVKLWEAGVLPQHVRRHGGQEVMAFDRAHLKDFARRWHERIGGRELSYSLGMSFHGVEQLAALKIISADAPALPGTGPYFEPSAVDGFLRKVESGQTAFDNPSIPLRKAILAIGGRSKPWGPICRAILDGRWAYRVGRDGGCLVDRISLSLHSVSDIATLRFDRSEFPDFDFSTRLSQGDALECLNLSANTRKPLEKLAAEGMNPKTYAVDDVESLASEIVLASEIGFALGIHPVAVSKWMISADVERCPEDFIAWPRAAAMAAVKASEGCRM